MIDRETPAKISRKQAIVPVLLGILSVLLSFGFFLGFGMSMVKSGFSGTDLHPLLRSFLGAFIQAGFPEELAKLLMILLTVRLFRRTVTNVYEYILIGMAVGFGFTLFEEMIYGSDGAVFRLTGVAAHSALNMLMGKHLALAKHNKLTGRGSVAGENALAFIVPVLIHTCYDACTSNNVFLNSTDENQELIGLILGLSAAVLIIVFEVMVFVKVKKNAAAYCAMATVEGKTTDIEDAQAWENGQ